MKKKLLFLGTIALTVIVSISMIACEEDGDQGPSIPKVPAYGASDIAAFDISGATTPTFATDEDAIMFFAAAAMQMGIPNVDSILGGISEGYLGNIQSRAVTTEKMDIDINLADYTAENADLGIKDLKGKIKGSVTAKMDDVKNTMSYSGNINANASYSFDVKDVVTDDPEYLPDVLKAKVKMEANGSMSMNMTETKYSISASFGAAGSLAMAYKDGAEGAKFILSFGAAGSVKEDIKIDEMSESGPEIMPDLSKIKGNVTLSIYNASDALVKTVKMDVDDLEKLISDFE